MYSATEDEWFDQEIKKEGPVLMFVEVLTTQPSGATWTSSSLRHLGDTLRGTLAAAGLSATVSRVRSRMHAI